MQTLAVALKEAGQEATGPSLVTSGSQRAESPNKLVNSPRILAVTETRTSHKSNK